MTETSLQLLLLIVRRAYVVDFMWLSQTMRHNATLCRKKSLQGCEIIEIKVKGDAT